MTTCDMVVELYTVFDIRDCEKEVMVVGEIIIRMGGKSKGKVG